MSPLSLSEFADKVSEIMPAIMRGLYKQETSEFYKVPITLAQFVVLDILVRDGETRMTDLARSINVTTAAMTGVVERLVKYGYAHRVSDPNDRRIIKVRHTPKGDRIVKSVLDQRKRMIGKMFRVVSQSEREEYLRILNNVRNNMREEENKSPR